MDVSQEDEITLQEALETQEMLESQSAAVLGASDPQNCSYSKGYMKRQALYACLTCNPKGAPFSQPAGVCLACSYTCHEGHELVELFTKRHFRCDCGNMKFPDNACKLQAEKEEANSENQYNQNFNGMYCSCHRPYPDPDQDNDVADDSMIQCIICEDWYHFQHCLQYLNVDFEALEDDFELICGPCMNRLDFLEYYSELAVKPSPEKVENSKDEIDTTATENCATVKNAEMELEQKNSKNKINNDDTSSQDSGVGGDSNHEPETSDGVCPLQRKTKGTLPYSGGVNAIAWKGNIRTALCRCPNCLSLYEELKIGFLLDTEDTIEHYEALGKKNAEAVKLSAEASINNQVNNLGRIGQIEFLHGYNHFKEQLAEFLKEHAEKGTVVQREDVNKFFAKVNEEQAAKRRRLE